MSDIQSSFLVIDVLFGLCQNGSELNATLLCSWTSILSKTGSDYD